MQLPLTVSSSFLSTIIHPCNLEEDHPSQPRRKRSLKAPGLPYWDIRDRLTSVDSAARQSLYTPCKTKPLMAPPQNSLHIIGYRMNLSGNNTSLAFVPNWRWQCLSIKGAIKLPGTALVRKSKEINSSQRKPENMCLCQVGLYGTAAMAMAPVRRHRGERTPMSL